MQEAAATYLCVLNGEEARHFSSIDRGLTGFKARHNLAIVYDDMGQLDQAEQQWQRVTEEAPGYTPGWRGLGDILLRQGKVVDVERLCERLNGIVPPLGRGSQDGAPFPSANSATPGNATRLADTPNLVNEARILRGKLAAARGDLAGAVTYLREADSTEQDDLEALRVLCRLLFEHGDLAAARLALEELCSRDPDDAAAHHNLGIMHIRRQNRQAAIQSLTRSLELRPNDATTRRQLEDALQLQV